MIRVIGKHTALGLLVVFTAITLTFALVRVSGDPTSIILPQDATDAQRVALRQSLGLDQPVLEQYFRYLGGAVHGNFGASYFDAEPVSGIVWHFLPNTLLLAASSFLLTIALAVPLGTLAAVWRGGYLDRMVQVVSVLGNSMPSFWSAVLLLQFLAVRLGWFPTYGNQGPASLVLPTVNLTLFFFPTIARLTRSAVLDVLPANYVTTARAKGLTDRRILLVHVIRNASVPVLALLGLQLGSLLGGAVLTEAVFAWPGIGTLAVRSIGRSDFPVVQGIVAYVAVIFAIVTPCTEILIRRVNPKLR